MRLSAGKANMKARHRLATTLLLTVMLPGVAVLSGGAAAQGDTLLARMADGGVTTRIETDIDADGDTENILHLSQPCYGERCRSEPVESDGVVAANGSAEEVHVEDFGARGGILVADGIFLGWNGQVLYPHDDLLSRLGAVQRSARAARDVRGQGGHDVRAQDITSYEVDLVGDERAERVHVVTGDTVNGLFRFHIVTPEGEELLSGYSMDRPRLYLHGAGAWAVSVQADGRLVTEAIE